MTLMLGAAAVAAVLWAVFTYNALVRSRNRATAAWSQIDVQLKRRHDLIPNLVEAVKGYFRHERGTLEAVARARQTALAAGGDIKRLAVAESSLGGAVRDLLAVVESYPELKAMSAVRDLMEQLSTAENRIAFARQHYNDSVMILNNMVDQFPQRILAGPLGFAKMDYFGKDQPAGGVVPGSG